MPGRRPARAPFGPTRASSVACHGRPSASTRASGLGSGGEAQGAVAQVRAHLGPGGEAETARARVLALELDAAAGRDEDDPAPPTSPFSTPAASSASSGQARARRPRSRPKTSAFGAELGAREGDGEDRLRRRVVAAVGRERGARGLARAEERGRVGVARAPGGPGREHGGHGLEAGAGAGPLARLPGELVPERPALAVEHEPHAPLHEAGRREAPRRRGPCARAVALEGHGRRREAAPDDGDVAAAERVVRDLVPVEPAERVGARLAAERDADHGVVLGEAGVVGGGVGGLGARASPGRAARRPGGARSRGSPRCGAPPPAAPRRRRARAGSMRPRRRPFEGVKAGRRPRLVPSYQLVQANQSAPRASPERRSRATTLALWWWSGTSPHLARAQPLDQHGHEAVVAAGDDVVEERGERVASGLERLVDAGLLGGGERLRRRRREAVRRLRAPRTRGRARRAATARVLARALVRLCAALRTPPHLGRRLHELDQHALAADRRARRSPFGWMKQTS